jgi:hypothetical protein
MKSTFGEFVFAIGFSIVVAVLAAIAGFVGAICLCGKVFVGEATEWGLILAPSTALVVGVIVFVFSFRKIVTYGEKPCDNP